MNTMQQRLPELGREISRLVGRDNLSTPLLRAWAVLAALGYSLLTLNPPIAGRYWLLLLVLGIGCSIIFTAIWLKQAAVEQKSAAKPWILHWSCLLVVLALQVLHDLQAGSSPTLEANAIASQCLLLSSLGLMTAGLYLRSSLLPAGMALAACYLYLTVVGVWGGIITGAVYATFLWSLSNESDG